MKCLLAFITRDSNGMISQKAWFMNLRVYLGSIAERPKERFQRYLSNSLHLLVHSVSMLSLRLSDSFINSWWEKTTREKKARINHFRSQLNQLSMLARLKIAGRFDISPMRKLKSFGIDFTRDSNHTLHLQPTITKRSDQVWVHSHFRTFLDPISLSIWASSTSNYVRGCKVIIINEFQWVFMLSDVVYTPEEIPSYSNYDDRAYQICLMKWQWGSIVV